MSVTAIERARPPSTRSRASTWCQSREKARDVCRRGVSKYAERAYICTHISDTLRHSTNTDTHRSIPRQCRGFSDYVRGESVKATHESHHTHSDDRSQRQAQSSRFPALVANKKLVLLVGTCHFISTRPLRHLVFRPSSGVCVCVYVSGARARTSKAEGDRGGEGRERSARVWPAEANERVSLAPRQWRGQDGQTPT